MMPQTLTVSRAPLAPTPDWFSTYRPIRWIGNGHAQTLAGNYWPRQRFALHSVAEPVVVDAADGSRVLCECHWQPEPVRSGRLTVLLVHGLEGSSTSQYVLGITLRAWAAGCNVIRMNMRNCGGTEAWSPTLYHSGLSGDVEAVLREMRSRHGLGRMAMVGYSMGGNLVLKLAGELADEAPAWLAAAVAVSPAADLAASADALHEPVNRLYERHFLRRLMRRFAAKRRLFPERYGAYPVEKSAIGSVREFDDRITAPCSGFRDADDYYDRAAAARVVGQIRIPTLVLHAADDPFIRLTEATRALLEANAHVDLVETSHGGHCAFLSRKDWTRVEDARRVEAGARGTGRDGGREWGRHWAEATLVRYLMATAGHVEA